MAHKSKTVEVEVPAHIKKAVEMMSSDEMRAALKCHDCKQSHANYMVYNSVWDLAFPDYAEVKRRYGFANLCLECLSSRLGRALTIDDFPHVPINQGVELGYKIGLKKMEVANGRP